MAKTYRYRSCSLSSGLSLRVDSKYGRKVLGVPWQNVLRRYSGE